MIARAFEEHLVGDAIVQVFTRMDFIADIHPAVLGMIQDRLPARGQFVEGGLDQPGRTLRPRIDIGPGQSAREGGMGLDAHVARGGQRLLDLVHRPFLPGLGIAAHRRRGKAVERLVIGRVHRDQLALKMGRELGHFDPVRGRLSLELIAVVL